MEFLVLVCPLYTLMTAGTPQAFGKPDTHVIQHVFLGVQWSRSPHGDTVLRSHDLLNQSYFGIFEILLQCFIEKI